MVNYIVKSGNQRFRPGVRTMGQNQGLGSSKGWDQRSRPRIRAEKIDEDQVRAKG